MEIVTDLYLSLGSNLGDRENNLSLAYSEIERKIGPIHQKSKYFENEAVGFESDNLFLNTAILVKTDKEPESILTIIKEIEEKLGRKKKQKDSGYTSRPIDIDIILFGSIRIESNRLTIPHVAFRQRKFVLLPLSEIAPNTVDPVTQLSVKQLLKLI